MELAKDLALIVLLVAATGCVIEICRCFRRVAAANERAANAQTAYWQSVDRDDWWKCGGEESV